MHSEPINARLLAFFERPQPFSIYSVDRLWTDPHRAKAMLDCHLDPDSDLASRRPGRIAEIVSWLDTRLGFAGKSVTDLGCGPGLYAEAMARRGASVTGIDFSANSLAHARAHAETEGFDIAYAKADYLNDPLPVDQDMIMLIYGDYCPLSPERRRHLLGKIKSGLKPGGVFVFDVFSTTVFSSLKETESIAHHPEGGFWAAGPHAVVSKTFLHQEDKIGLDRYLVATENDTEEICNWMQYFDEAAIRAELAAAGFGEVTTRDIASGGPLQAGAEAFMIIARI